MRRSPQAASVLASLASFASLVLLAACGGPVTGELETAKSKWAAQSLRSSYQYEFTQTCFCPLANEPVIIQVKNGAVVSAAKKSDGAQVDDQLGWRPTIDDLLSKVEKADAEADQLTATFDPTLGYPASVSIDWLADAVDDELAFTVADVKSIP